MPRVDAEGAYCWRCGAGLPGSEWGGGYSNGYGDRDGDGNGDGARDDYGDACGDGYMAMAIYKFGNNEDCLDNGDGNGGGDGDLLPLCDDALPRAINPESAYCWRCGSWLPGSDYGDGNDDGTGNGSGVGVGGYGNGNGYGYGYGHERGDGYSWGYGYGGGNGRGYGYGAPLPLCGDVLACAIRQAGETFFDQPPVRSTGE